MQVFEAFKKLQSSSGFKKWYSEHKTSYLSYGFIMKDPDVREEWQFGYYNPGKDTITTFILGKKIIRNPDSEIFKNKTKVKKLDVKKVKLELEDALKIADTLQDKEYPAQHPIKKIIILQNLDIGQVWNITFVTHTFKTLNIKIDSSTKKVLKHDLIDLFKVDK